MEYAIAVIDIGMTNKKVAVYDDKLRQLAAEYKVFEPKMVQADGGLSLPCHDLEAMEAWFTDVLRGFASQYPVKALAVTTHGATFVCTGSAGQACVPCVYYTYEPGEAFQACFYEQFGSPEALQEETKTPRLGAMINAAKGIYFAQKTFPEAFAQTQQVLMYPQYWAYRFTGKAGGENTAVNNHSYLWNPVKNAPSSVAQKLGVASLLPRHLSRSWDAAGTLSPDFAARSGLGPDTIVTMGIHDSNASLLPHFAKKGISAAGAAPFVLNSTGTWCVLMHPVESYRFRPGELGKVVFFNTSALGTPVKTSIFLGGQEFETWMKVLERKHGRKDFPPYKPGLYQQILQEKRAFLMPELTAGSGQFPGSKPRVVEDGKDYPYDDIKDGSVTPPCFQDYESGVAVLRISLVMQTLTALEGAGLSAGESIYTEGGFRHNEAYNAILSAALPEHPAYTTDIPEATALGAAMTAKMALTGLELKDLADDFEVEYRETVKSTVPGLEAYRKAWLDLIT
jgi:sugar (pentulose or hexulose) kinase